LLTGESAGFREIAAVTMPSVSGYWESCDRSIGKRIRSILVEATCLASE
jgi:hypothetical protein